MQRACQMIKNGISIVQLLFHRTPAPILCKELIIWRILARKCKVRLGYISSAIQINYKLNNCLFLPADGIDSYWLLSILRLKVSCDQVPGGGCLDRSWWSLGYCSPWNSLKHVLWFCRDVMLHPLL